MTQIGLQNVDEFSRTCALLAVRAKFSLRSFSRFHSVRFARIISQSCVVTARPNARVRRTIVKINAQGESESVWKCLRPRAASANERK